MSDVRALAYPERLSLQWNQEDFAYTTSGHTRSQRTDRYCGCRQVRRIRRSNQEAATHRFCRFDNALDDILPLGRVDGRIINCRDEIAVASRNRHCHAPSASTAMVEGPAANVTTRILPDRPRCKAGYGGDGGPEGGFRERDFKSNPWLAEPAILSVLPHPPRIPTRIATGPRPPFIGSLLPPLPGLVP